MNNKRSRPHVEEDLYSFVHQNKSLTCRSRKILVRAGWLIEKTPIFLSLIQDQSEPEPEDEDILDKNSQPNQGLDFESKMVHTHPLAQVNLCPLT